jgi:hypothetical protein
VGFIIFRNTNPQVKVLAPMRNLNIELEEVYGELVAWRGRKREDDKKQAHVAATRG